jgi:hypothetical protein
VKQIVMPYGQVEQFRDAMRGGLWSSSSVPGAGMLTPWL